MDQTNNFPVLPNPRGISPLRILALLAFALVIAVLSSVGTYWFMSNQLAHQQTQQQAYQLSPTAAPIAVHSSALTLDKTGKWSTYKNDEFGFSVTFPVEWAYKDYGKISGNDLTIIAFGERLDPQTFIAHGVSGLEVEIFQQGYYMGGEGSSRETLTEDTDLVYFIRAMNGLLPDESFKEVSKEERFIGGKQAIRYKFANGAPRTAWYIKNGGNIYELVLQDNGADQLGKILDSFKFDN